MINCFYDHPFVLPPARKYFGKIGNFSTMRQLMTMLKHAGIIGLLWTPLLLYSSSNPTFQVPLVSDFMFNATIIYKTHNETGHPLGETRVPLFRSTEQYTVMPWLKTNNSEALPGNLAAYDAKQLQLMCGAEDSDAMWMPATPLRDEMLRALAAEALRGRRRSASAIQSKTRRRDDLSESSHYSQSHEILNTASSSSAKFNISSSSDALQRLRMRGTHAHSRHSEHEEGEEEQEDGELIAPQGGGGVARSAADMHAEAFYAQKFPRVWIEFGFSTLRDKPLPTAYGGPGCEGRARLQLDSDAVTALHDVLTKRQVDGALLTGWQQPAHGSFTSVGASGVDRISSKSGFMWVWQLKYHKCNVAPMSTEQIVSAHDKPQLRSAAKLADWPKFRVHFRAQYQFFPPPQIFELYVSCGR